MGNRIGAQLQTDVSGTAVPRAPGVMTPAMNRRWWLGSILTDVKESSAARALSVYPQGGEDIDDALGRAGWLERCACGVLR